MEPTKKTSPAQSANTTQKPVAAFDELLRLGFSVIPIQERGKLPLLKSWKPFQQRRATADELTSWARDFEGANLAIVTGAISAVLVLDIDDEAKAGPFIAEHGGIPITPTVQTANGRHLYFAHPGYKCKNSVKNLPGMDIRGDGGYVVAPPSIHETGALYEWITHPDAAPYAPIPAWLIPYVREIEGNGKTKVAPAPMIGGTPYGLAALDREADAVRTTQTGGRNARLNQAAFACGQLIAGNELERGDVERGLLSAALASGLSEHESRGTIRSGIESGMKNPRTAPPRDTQHNAPLRSHADKSDAAPITRRPYTDLGNAERLADRQAGKLLYDHTGHRWLVWDGRRWANDDDGTTRRLAKETVRTIPDELKLLPDEEGDARSLLLKHAAKSENTQRIDGMLRLAESDPIFAANQKALDTHPDLLNLFNGTMDLSTLKFREHRASDRLTKISPVEFDAGATCPTWISFLRRIFEENDELVLFVQQSLGYALTASTKEQVFFILHGTGSNGKSTLLDTVKFILGDYARQADFASLLLKREEGGPREDIAALVGSRLVVSSESEKGRRLAESLIKSLTGGDTIRTRRLYQEGFEFIPEFKLFLASNHKPRIAGTDWAIWRRVRFIPFNVTIPDAEQDHELGDKLKTEASGILNWMLAGFDSWQEKGLITPSAVSKATAAYRTEQDALVSFFEERCAVTPSSRVKLAELFESYKQWATENEERVLNRHEFSQILTERGFQTVIGHGNVRYIEGLGLLAVAG